MALSASLRRRPLIAPVVLVLLFTLASAAPAQRQAWLSIPPDSILHRIRVLSSDSLEGRRAGTPGADKAARYLAALFKELGAHPAGDSGTYFQSFDFVSGVKLGPSNVFALQFKPGTQVSSNKGSRPYVLEKDFIPYAFAQETTVTAPIVFVGYGISAPELNYDDYNGVDVRGKVALALRYSPDGEMGRGKFAKHTGSRFKAIRARQKGAVALILISGPAQGDDQLPKLRYDNDPSDAGLPVIGAKRSLFEPLIVESLELLQEKMDSKLANVSQEIPNVTATVATDVVKLHSRTRNVLGCLPGNDPTLKDQVVVIGAHYDHLGYGGEGSLIPDTVALHPGADDNASGTAGIVELLSAFADRARDLRRSVLFIAFSAEEEGTLGSQYYVKHPAFPLTATVGMINMDMIGRMKDSTLIVYGIGTSPIWKPLLLQFDSDSSIHLKLNPDGYGPSDQSSFYANDLPVLFLFSGLHEDYHRPSDTWEKINAPEEARVLRLAGEVAFAVDTMPARPLFTKADSAPAPSGGRGYGVYVGTVPDFGEQVNGFKISGVRTGSPADKAGLIKGDIIVKFGNMDIKSLYDYTYALGEYKPGEEVAVVLRRGDKILTVTVKLEQRK